MSSDVCLKWRKLPFAQKNVGRELPDDWCCAMHPETDFNRFVFPFIFKVKLPKAVNKTITISNLMLQNNKKFERQ